MSPICWKDELGESIRNDPKLKLVFSGGVATFLLDFFDMWDPKSPWSDQRVRKAASLAIDRQGAERRRYARRFQAQREHRA